MGGLALLHDAAHGNHGADDRRQLDLPVALPHLTGYHLGVVASQ
jgi:hypothetical protein